MSLNLRKHISKSCKWGENMVISQIVAIAKNHVIGKENDIPWRIPGEQKRFKELTMNKTVIMGRKTYESLGSGLKGRDILIVSRTMKNQDAYSNSEGRNDFIVFRTVSEALDHCKGQDEVFIAGGGQIYKDTIDLSHKLYITELDEEIEGTVYYPMFNRNHYEVTYEKHVPDASIPYTYMTYEKK